MAKLYHNDVLDAALNTIKNNADRQVACTQAPATYADVDTYKVVAVSLTGTDFDGPKDGVSSGRRVTVAAKTGITVTATGDPVVLVIVDDGNQKILVQTDETSAQTLTQGNPVDWPAWDIEFEDPA